MQNFTEIVPGELGPPPGVERKRSCLIHISETVLDTASDTIMTNNRKSYRRSPIHFVPSRVTPNKGSGPQFWDTVYISEVNGARKVKSYEQVVMSNFFLRDGWGSAPN